MLYGSSSTVLPRCRHLGSQDRAPAAPFISSSMAFVHTCHGDVLGVVKLNLATYGDRLALCATSRQFREASYQLGSKDTAQFVVGFLSTDDVKWVSQCSVRLLMLCRKHYRVTVHGIHGSHIMDIIVSNLADVFYVKRKLGAALGLHRCELQLSLQGNPSILYNLHRLRGLNTATNINLMMVRVAPECLYCGGTKPNGSLSFCGRCHHGTYCSVFCKLMDWQRHKPECRAWASPQ